MKKLSSFFRTPFLIQIQKRLGFYNKGLSKFQPQHLGKIFEISTKISVFMHQLHNFATYVVRLSRSNLVTGIDRMDMKINKTIEQ
jgi:hypothetical protein